MTEEHSCEQNSAQKSARTIWRFLDSGFFSPKALSYEPLILLLNDEDSDRRDELTHRWLDHKLAELNFVGIVSALLTGCLTSTGSWPNILPSGVMTPWSVRCCWYCGITFGLASILAAADQTIRLHRISAHRDAPRNLRLLLSSRARDDDGQRLPRRFQVYAWQMPVFFLLCSSLCLIIGMFTLVWSATWHHTKQAVWWDDNAKVAVTFTIVTLITVLVFLGAQLSFFSPVVELDEENTSSDEEGRNG